MTCSEAEFIHTFVQVLSHGYSVCGAMVKGQYPRRQRMHGGNVLPVRLLYLFGPPLASHSGVEGVFAVRRMFGVLITQSDFERISATLRKE
jgi:hypothetical protein